MSFKEPTLCFTSFSLGLRDKKQFVSKNTMCKRQGDDSQPLASCQTLKILKITHLSRSNSNMQQSRWFPSALKACCNANASTITKHGQRANMRNMRCVTIEPGQTCAHSAVKFTAASSRLFGTPSHGAHSLLVILPQSQDLQMTWNRPQDSFLSIVLHQSCKQSTASRSQMFAEKRWNWKGSVSYVRPNKHLCERTNFQTEDSNHKEVIG